MEIISAVVIVFSSHSLPRIILEELKNITRTAVTTFRPRVVKKAQWCTNNASIIPLRHQVHNCRCVRLESR